LKQTIPLVWVYLPGPPAERRAQLPEPPEGHHLAWSCANEEAGTVDFEFAENPPAPPEPEPEG
jgi:hypothetical protein